MDSEDFAALDFFVGAIAGGVGVGRRALVVLRLEVEFLSFGVCGG